MVFENIARGKFNPKVGYTIIAILILGFWGPLIAWYLQGVVWSALVMLVIQGNLVLFSETVGYHRGFTHETFECGRKLKKFFLAAGGHGLIGYAKVWVGNHRQHHAFTDVPGDPHSPLAGFLFAFIEWLWDDTIPPKGFKPAISAEDLELMEWQKRWMWLFVLSGFIIPGLVCGIIAGWPGFIQGVLVAGFMRAAMTYCAAGLVNAVCHLWGWRYFTENVRQIGTSVNNLWVALMVWGEGWHNNHHGAPRSARLGLRRFDWDPGWWSLCLLGQLGLVWNVHEWKLEKRGYKIHFPRVELIKRAAL